MYMLTFCPSVPNVTLWCMFQLSDSLESLVEELHYLSDQVQYADPIAANPDALREQMADNNVS